MADIPQGGLGQAAAPPPPQPGTNTSPAFQSSPFGYAANPSVLAASMDPDRIMSLLKSNTVDDEDIRRHKFLAGLGAPTRSGSIGESFSNALGALGDTEMEQKKLVAQYAPMMMQHMLGVYNASITGAEKNQSMLGGYNSALNARVGAMLRSGAPVTAGTLQQVVQNAGQEFGIPSSYLSTYYKGIAGGAATDEDISDSIRTRILAGQKPEEQQKTIAPPTKLQNFGGQDLSVPQEGSPGFTPPQNMPPPSVQQTPKPELTPPKMTTDSLGQPYIEYRGQKVKANTSVGQALQAMYQQDLKRMNASAMGDSNGPAPLSPEDAARTAPPIAPVAPPPGPPPGAAPQGGPPPGAPPQPPGPPGGMPQTGPNPANVGGMPGAPVSGRLQILQQELEQAKTPEDKAALMREIALVSKNATPQAPGAPAGGLPAGGAAPGAGASPVPLAPGVTAMPGKPDPALQPGDKAGALSAGQSVQFNDVPTLPDDYFSQGMGVGGVNPLAKELATKNATDFQADTQAQGKVVSSMQEQLRRMQVIQGIAQQVKLGSTAGMREEAGAHALDLLNMTPGVSPETAKAVSDKIAGGDLAALQQFQKLAVSGAMVGLRADIGSSGGQRVAMQEFMQYLKAVPNSEMSPVAIAKLREMAVRDYMRARTEQDARASFLQKGPSADFGQFDKYWADKQDKLGIVPTNVNIGGGQGSGLPYQNIQFNRDAKGRPIATDGRKDAQGNTRWFVPNEKFLTNQQ